MYPVGSPEGCTYLPRKRSVESSGMYEDRRRKQWTGLELKVVHRQKLRRDPARRLNGDFSFSLMALNRRIPREFT